MMMGFEEFKSTVVGDIKDYLPENFADATVTLQDVMKNNDVVMTGLMIKEDGNNTAPTIYMERYYGEYMDGTDMDSIMRDIANTRVANDLEQGFDVTWLTDFEQVKDRITCRLVNAEMNTEYLADKPSTRMEDLAVMYAIDLGGEPGAHMSTPVTNRLMEIYGITGGELHETALANLEQSEPVFMTMKDVIMDMLEKEGIPEGERAAIASSLEAGDGVPMYILTNEDRVNGASSLLNERAMEDISQKLGGDFIVLPSSVHETIILPVSEEFDRESLEGMVQQINFEQVAQDERLSDHVYQYDSKGHELVRMDRMEERQRQKAQEREAEKKTSRGRVSMKEKLSEKKAEIMKKENNREKAVPSIKKEASLG
jgi:hypothetical protein